LIGKLWGGLYRGQEQHWFLARFEGTDDDVDLEAHETPEFCEFRWVPASTLPDLIVPFKKRVYRAIVTEFADLI
ncbi:MAG: NUDIX domain-containing protein, partial [Pseudomonadota bacterium]|nr:NUDIX domain-containing protein [Pseudomonadota bacterium]